jgi:type IV pilus assembly protein PilA
MSTSTHPVAPEEVMAFLDGELSADRAQSVSAHIEQCAECRDVSDSFRNASITLASWTVAAIPTQAEGRVKVASQNTPSVTSATDLRGLPSSKRWAWKQGMLVFGVSAAVLVLLFAIATPNLLRSRMAANEASAVGSLRSLNTAAATYVDSYGHFPRSLENFGSSPNGVASEDGAGLIDDVLAKGGRKSGYLFTYRAVPGFGTSDKGGYRITADPLAPRQSGQRHFSTNQTGTIFADGFSLDDLRTPEKLSINVGPDGQVLANDVESAPMIARRAELKVLVEKLEDARHAMDRILAEHKGYVAQLSASAESGSARVVIASLRVPADRLDICLAELKKLGHVTEESQAGEEVTQQHVDLAARLKNSRNTEERLSGVLQQRSGPVKEVLEVEKESARVRGEIEQMEAEQQNLEHRVSFATIDLKLAEEYKAQLTSPAPSVGMQLRNAIVNGFRNACESLLGIILFFAEAGPTLLLWLAILFIPARLLWRRYQRAYVMSGSSLGA